MPCYLLNLTVQNQQYRVADLIAAEKINERTMFRRIYLQAALDNTANILGGDSTLSGVKFGWALIPGAARDYFSEQNNLSTLDLYLMCQDAANQKLSIELLSM